MGFIPARDKRARTVPSGIFSICAISKTVKPSMFRLSEFGNKDLIK